MEPFPSFRRRLYLFAFIIFFIFLLPAVLFYADGWRFIPDVGIVKTGGIYIEVPYQDAVVTINGLDARRSSFLQRSFYIDDLTPGAYVIRVEKPGYRSWGRILVVEPQLVTDATALLLPNEITLKPLSIVVASSTKTVSRAVYESYLDAFATSSPPHASSTLPIDVSGDVGLFLEEGQLFARWLSNRHPSSIFCETPLICRHEIPIRRDGGMVIDARFFGNGIVYQTKEGNVYFTEVDVRLSPVSSLIVGSEGLLMRVVGGALVVKIDTALYEVLGL